MKVSLTPVLGLPEYSGWSQVFHNPQKTVVCALTVLGSDAANVGLELLDILQNTNVNNAAQFHQVLELLLQTAKEKDCNLQLSASFQEKEKEAVVFATYNASVLLKRDQKIGVLLKSQDKLNLIEGSVSPGDRVVLMSDGASSFAQEIVQKLKTGFDTDSIVVSLIPQVHRLKNSSLTAIVFMQITNEEQLQEPEQQIESEFADLGGEEEESEEDNNTFDKLFSFEAKDFESEQQLIDEEKKVAFSKKIPKIEIKKLTAFFAMFWLWLKKIFSRAAELIKKISSSDAEYLGQGERRKKIIRIALIISFTVVPVLGLLIFRWQNMRTEINDLDKYMAPVLQRVESAKEIVTQDPIKARSEIEISLEEIEVLKKKFENKSHAEKNILQQEQKIKSFYEEISGREEFSELSTFFDLRLIDTESDFIASSVDLSGNIAIFLDADKNNLLELNLENKQGRKLNLPENSDPRAISFDGENIFVLENGISSYSIDSDELKKLRDEGDSNKNASFVNYFGRFIYVFNADKRNIYRYSPGEEGEYSDPIGWLKDKQGLDFAATTGVQIDGDVWLSNKAGEIKRYIRGDVGEFEIRGLKDAFSSSIYLFTKEDQENLYILEPEKNRLVVITKNGDFVKEIKSSTLASATMIIVSEENSKAYAVSGSLLYEIGL